MSAGETQAGLTLITALIRRLVDKGLLTKEEALGVCADAEQIRDTDFQNYHSRTDMTRAIDAVKPRLVTSGPVRRSRIQRGPEWPRRLEPLRAEEQVR